MKGRRGGSDRRNELDEHERNNNSNNSNTHGGGKKRARKAGNEPIPLENFPTVKHVLLYWRHLSLSLSHTLRSERDGEKSAKQIVMGVL